MASAARLNSTDQDDVSLMDNSISSHHRRCFEDFERVLSLLDAPSHLFQQHISSIDVFNEFDRYKLWCSNVGAAHDGRNYRLSLDYRLREAPSYKEQIGEVLNRMAETLERTRSLLEGSSQPFESKSLWDDVTEFSSDAEPSSSSEEDDGLWGPEDGLVSEESQEDVDFRRRIASIRGNIAATVEVESTQGAPIQQFKDSQSLNEPQSPILEVPQLLQTIRFTVTCLYRIPIRRPATLERSKKLATMNIEHFEPFDNAYIDDRCPAASTTLKQRLQRMTSRRRRLLLYRAQHYEHIKVDLSQRTPEATRELKTLNPTTDIKQLEMRPAASEKESSKPSQFSKATTFNPVDFPDLSTNLLDLDRVSETESLPSTNPSLWTGNQKLYIPPHPKGVAGGQYFLCPYCFVLCPVKSDEAWKRHLLKDLEPYICTFANCVLEDHQFDDRNDWYEHELQKHRIEWCCNLDGHAPCTSPSEFLSHLEDHHPNLQSSSLSQDVIRQFQRPAQRYSKICPLCSKPSEKLKTHLSRHMEQIALYVLGGNNQEDAEPGSDASDKARRVDSSADLSSDDDDVDWKPAEIAAPAALHEDFLDEQTIIPDTTEAPWTIPFDLIGSLSLTATLIIFSNFTSSLVFPRLVYPDSIPLHLRGIQTLGKTANTLENVLSMLHANMEARNTLGCLTPIERDLDVIADEAMKLCRDLELQTSIATRGHPSPDLGSQENLENFLPTITPRRLWELSTMIDRFRSKLEGDILLPLSAALRMSDNMLSDSIQSNENTTTVSLFTRLKEYDSGPLLANLPKEALHLPKGVSPDDDSENLQHSPGLVEDMADDASNIVPEDDNPQSRTIRDAIISSLNFPMMKDREEEIITAHEKTFEWIFQSQTLDSRPSITNFAEWLRNGDGIFWISGKAGSGKSTLLKFICGHHQTMEILREWSPRARVMITSFFFWGSGTSEQRSTIGFLRTILRDLLRQAPDKVMHVVPRRWGDVAQTMEHRDDGITQRDRPVSSSGLWSLAELKEALVRLLTQLDHVCLFIDGLDELKDDHGNFIQMLKSVLSQKVKICLTSRPWTIFYDNFNHGYTLRLQDLTYHDIKLYVDQILGKNATMIQLSQREPIRASALVEEIVAKAEGVFLWVFLVVRSLLRGLDNYDTITHLRRRLEQIPADLENLYSHMLGTIDPAYLAWGSRALLLCRRADQFQGSLCAVGLSLSYHLDGDSEQPIAQAPFSCLSPQETAMRVQKIVRALESRCGGLLELVANVEADVPLAKEGNLQVKYTHRTVADFLHTRETSEVLSQGAGLDFNPDRALLECYVLRLRRGFHTPIQRVSEPHSEYPLWANLVIQAMELAGVIEEELGVSETELLDELAKAISLQYGKPPHNDCLNFLAFATVHGLARYLTDRLKDTDGDVECLFLALCHPWKRTSPHEGVVALLLQRGFDPNRRLGRSTVWQDYLNVIAGQETTRTDADIGHLKIIEMLLRHGADPMERYQRGGTQSVLGLVMETFPRSVDRLELEGFIMGLVVAQEAASRPDKPSSNLLSSGLKWTRKTFGRRKD
ncbi:hypothetical protein DL98DRAFT_581881 [Cadophora sp. DSE1049]|nr:hypothetical protein DL98DRAFT_581881 [Cadophora sp. DSE1049]